VQESRPGKCTWSVRNESSVVDHGQLWQLYLFNYYPPKTVADEDDRSPTLQVGKLIQLAAGWKNDVPTDDPVLTSCRADKRSSAKVKDRCVAALL